MADAYRSFGNFILFKDAQTDDLGHLYRAGEFDSTGIKRSAWLRVFDGPRVSRSEIVGGFEKGKQVADLLQAANVASGVTYFQEDGVPAMAYDFVAARPLSRLFEKVQEEGFPVPVDNALLIMEKLALGLSSALVLDSGGHSLVHGFLHPGLVVVTNDGEAVVSGFGVADQLLGLLDDPEAAERITPYLAPEVITTRITGKRGDVYSLGSILFHLLTDSPLPSDPELRADALANAELSYDGEPIPPDIKTLLERAIALRPEDRFSSAADFKKELDKLLYGGNYSPTTFNLALFMDRLFRADIEADEKDAAAEAAVDVTPYLAPEPEPEPLEETLSPAAKGGGHAMYYAIAAGLLLVAVVVVFMMSRGSSGPPPAPTPSPEQIAAQRAAQEEKIRELAARMVEETMAEKEAEIMQQLEERQNRIESLQKKLEQSQRAPSASDKAQRQNQQEIERQLRAAQDEQRRQEEALEAEKQRLLEQAQKDAEEQARKQALAALAAETNPPTTASATEDIAENTEAGATEEPSSSGAGAVITENQFVDPTELDSLPAVIKSEPVDWPRSAQRSRRRGIVVLQATVNAKGQVESVQVLRADESQFGIPEAVVESVEKYLFKPGIKNGVKVKTHATVTQRYVFR